MSFGHEESKIYPGIEYRQVLSSDDEARSCAGGLCIIPDKNAVDENFFDADGKLLRFCERSVVDYCSGIEEDQVRIGALAKNPAIFSAEALRGQ